VSLPSRLRMSALLAADVLAVLLFAAVGRRSHAEGLTAAGVLGTAWPFLTGVAVGWLLTRAWKRPTAVTPVGVGAWLAALLVGMLLRRVTGEGTAWPFVVVATVVLAALLLGWRFVVHLVRRRAQVRARGDRADLAERA
jgi:peptidoglycan/LPS O-acetylase OafA/YrhL